MSGREWTSLYDSTKRRIISRRQTGQAFPPAETKAINELINQLDSQLKNMMASPMEYEIAASEIARRQVLVESLNKMMSNVPTGVQSFNTQAASSGSAGFSTGTLNPMATTDRGLMQRQKDIIKLQDDMILDIGAGVDRLHMQATTIGEETKQQTRLLGDLEMNVDDTSDALNAEAKHANEVKEKAATCGMYICVAVEVIILLILIFVMVAT